MAARLEFQFHQRIADIPSATWNALANNASPFLQHEFLNALEQSGSVSAQTGWQPHHLLVLRGNKAIGAVPLYIKGHSYGEYVFDWSWADAYRQSGRQYYPKLISAVPFTPSYATRLLIASDENLEAIGEAMSRAVIEEAKRLNMSSWHVLFPTESESQLLAAQGAHQRVATQFHWFNRGYISFEHYLESFNSRKRKNLRKERRAVQDANIQFERYSGRQISAQLWEVFYRFYQNTYHVRGQQAYLDKSFFTQLGETLSERLLLVVALLEGQPIAAALSFRDEKKLYGRYWGCQQEYQFLHFETCYYQGIEYCIENGLQSFDSGAQGEHKIQRGFEPITTYSNHWIADPQFDVAIANYLHEERDYIHQYRDQASAMLPFKVEGQSKQSGKDL